MNRKRRLRSNAPRQSRLERARWSLRDDHGAGLHGCDTMPSVEWDDAGAGLLGRRRTVGGGLYSKGSEERLDFLLFI